MLASHRVTLEEQGVPEITALGTFLTGVVISGTPWQLLGSYPKPSA